MPFKNNPGCRCCEETGVCFTRYLSGWRFGHGNVVKTVHQDFAATYVDYTQREERTYDSGNNLLSTVVISQSYPNAYSSAGTITESVENNNFYSGEFISGASDTFKSETLVTSQVLPGGGRIDTYDVVYDRSANVRVSNGVALFEGKHPQLDSFALSYTYTGKSYYNNWNNKPAGTYQVESVFTSYASVIGNAGSKIEPTGYSIDPDAIGDRDNSLFGNLSTGVSNATATSANTRTAVDALRGSGPEGEQTWFLNTTKNIELNYLGTVYSNGTDHTLCVIGQKDPTINGPAGCGFSNINLSFGYEDLSKNFTSFASQETRPQVTLWDMVDSTSDLATTESNGPRVIKFTVPESHGVRIQWEKESIIECEYIRFYDSTDTTQNQFSCFWGTDGGNSGTFNRRNYFKSLTTQTWYAPRNAAFVPVEMFEHFGLRPGEYPWPQDAYSATTYSFCYENVEIFPQNPTTGSLATNLVSINVDDGIAPTVSYRPDSCEPYLIFNPTTTTSWATGIPQTAFATVEYTGGDYVCEFKEEQGNQVLEYIDIVQYNATVGGAACDKVIGCDDTLSYKTSGTHESSHLLIDRKGNWEGGFSDQEILDWYQLSQVATPPTQGNNCSYGDSWWFLRTVGCTTYFDWNYESATNQYLYSNIGVKGSISLTGPIDDAEIALTIELITVPTDANIDGPYTMTMDGIDLTANDFNDHGYMVLTLGEDTTGFGANKWKLVENVFNDVLGEGTVASGSHPFPFALNDVLTLELYYNGSYNS
jgi:hypothetical protein